MAVTAATSPSTRATATYHTIFVESVRVFYRAPLDELTSEATYEVHIAMRPESVGAVRDLLTEALAQASYPIREIEVFERALEMSEIVATLVNTAVDPAELDAVAAKLEQSPLVSYASWSSSSPE